MPLLQSTITFTNDLAATIDNKLQVDMAILDYSKAFNKVAHAHLD